MSSMPSLPVGWRRSQLSDHLVEPIRNGFSPVCPAHFTGEWVLSLASVGIEGYNPQGAKPAPAGDFRVIKSRLATGDLLVSRSNTPERVGLAGIYDGDPAPASYPDLLMRVRVAPTINQRLLLEQILSPKGRSYFAATARGSSGSMVKIDRAILEAFPILAPYAEDEQQAIADALSDANALIDSLEQLLTKKRQIKQGAMQELLTGKRRLPGFQENWGEATFDDVAFIDPENLGSGTPADFSFNYIALEGVNQGRLDAFAELRFDSAPSRAKRVLRDGDVLVSTVRPNLKSHLLLDTLNGSWIASTGFSVVRCKPGIACPGFLFALLFSAIVEQQIDALLTGSNYPAINGRDVANLVFACPPFDEQVAIAESVADMDAEIAALEGRLTKARTLKQSMAQALLTGRIRLVEPTA